MDHILDQSPVSRPRTPSLNFNLPSPLATTTVEPAFRSRLPSVSDVINPLTGLPGASTPKERALSTSSVDMSLPKPTATAASGKDHTASLPAPIGTVGRTSGSAHLNAEQLASRLPPHLLALRSASVPGTDHNSPFAASPPGGSPQASQPASPERDNANHPLHQLRSASAPSASAAAAAGRRLSMLALTPTDAVANGGLPIGGPPILVNPKCSGYFVEPVRPLLRPMLVYSHEKVDLDGTYHRFGSYGRQARLPKRKVRRQDW